MFNSKRRKAEQDRVVALIEAHITKLERRLDDLARKPLQVHLDGKRIAEAVAKDKAKR